MAKYNVACPVGHSILKNGSITSADGRKHGGVIEYEWCKKFVPYLVQVFKAQPDWDAEMIICPERKFSKASEEKNYKINIVNSGRFTHVCESHLNASDGKAKGTETLYFEKSSKGKVLAQNVNDKLDDLFADRGAKSRTDLYILRDTKPIAILNEYFFCDSMEDYKKADEINEMQLIALKTVEGFIGKTPVNPFSSSNSSKPPYMTGDYNRKGRLTSNLNFRKGRGTSYEVVKSLPKGTIIDCGYCKDNWFGTYSVTYVDANGKTQPTFCSGDYIELI